MMSVVTGGMVVGVITICSIFVKLLFTFIDMKFKSPKEGIVNLEDIQEFCKSAQLNCPKILGIAKLDANMETVANTLKEVVEEQKKLRQETLPEKYVGMPLFNDSVKRIERSVEKIFERINDLNDNIDSKISTALRGGT